MSHVIVLATDEYKSEIAHFPGMFLSSDLEHCHHFSPQEKSTNLVHIESRASRKVDESYDILLELEDGGDPLDDVVGLLLEHVSGLKVHGFAKASPLEKMGRDSEYGGRELYWQTLAKPALGSGHGLNIIFT